MADESADEGKRNARIALESRVREIAREESDAGRRAMWLGFGFDVSDPAGVREVKAVLAGLKAIGIDPTDPKEVDRWHDIIAWAGRAYDASVTRNKRLLFAITWVVSIAGGLIAIVKFYLDWRHP